MQNVKRAIAGMTLLTMVAPLAAFAETNTEVQIKALMSQIQTLQLQLKTLISTSMDSSTTRPDGMGMPPGQMGKMMCLRLDRDLRVGSRGDDVKKLQEMLASDKETGFSGAATGYFGPMTARAMVKFQMRMGIASSTTGNVGPMTRGFFERTCGKGLGMDDGMMKRAAIAGEITANSSSSITVKVKDGNTRVVNITGSTTISVFATATSSPTTGTISDLTVGKSVMAEGDANADGSLTARMIKVGILPPPPMMRGNGDY